MNCLTSSSSSPQRILYQNLTYTVYRMTDYDLDIVNNPLAWFPVDGVAKTSEGMTGISELSFSQAEYPLSMSASIPIHDTNGTNGVSCSTKYASNAALSFRQGRLALDRYEIAATSTIYPQGMLHTPAHSYGSSYGIANRNSDSVHIPLQSSLGQVSRDEYTKQYCSGGFSNDLSGSQQPTARSLHLIELRDSAPNLSKASCMIKDRKPSRYTPHCTKVIKAKPSQKKTTESFRYEIAQPISYCSLELFATWVEEYHWLDGDVKTSTFRYRFIGGALCHFKEWALKRARRNDDLVKICALCFWTYGSFYPKRVRKKQAACRCILVTEEKRQGNPLITQSTRYYPADKPRDL